jgi:hypothetical protein
MQTTAAVLIIVAQDCTQKNHRNTDLVENEADEQTRVENTKQIRHRFFCVVVATDVPAPTVVS